MGKKPHKSFPDESLKKKVKAQAEKIRYLEREIKRLKGENKTRDAAFKKAAEYMADESGPISVEKLIKDAEKHKPLLQSKKEVTPEDEREAVRKKWDEWNRSRAKVQEEEE